MKTRLLLGMLIVSACLSACSKRRQAAPAGPGNQASGNAAATRPAPKPQKPRIPSSLSVELAEDVKMKLTLVPAGKFMMGGEAPPAELAARFKRYGAAAEHYAAEQPQRKVTISKPFYMGRWEVTRPEWTALMKTRPWDSKKCDKPNSGNIANHVSWDQAAEFCKAMSDKTGLKVALPSEAQWEYACRAGSKSAFSFGDDDSRLKRYAWYAANTLIANEAYPHTAGRKTPNRWGLFDMHGNAAEWCSDWYDAKFYEKAPAADPLNSTKTEQRVLRGGQFGEYPDSCRSAYRAKANPTTTRCGYGFRVVIQVEPQNN